MDIQFPLAVLLILFITRKRKILFLIESPTAAPVVITPEHWSNSHNEFVMGTTYFFKNKQHSFGSLRIMIVECNRKSLIETLYARKLKNKSFHVSNVGRNNSLESAFIYNDESFRGQPAHRGFTAGSADTLRTLRYHCGM